MTSALNNDHVHSRNKDKRKEDKFSFLKRVYHKIIDEKGLFCEALSSPLPVAGRIMILKPDFISKHFHFLLESDQSILSNISFRYLLFIPGRKKHDTCLIVGHGFNEASYIKLVPWAYILCKRLEIPIVLFPLSFHINRRGTLWQREVISSFRKRREIPGNSHSSPFNAVVSKRISENPERFFRGSCQSYHDLLSLLNRIVEGKLEIKTSWEVLKPFTPDTNVHFLGYSISGYLHLFLLLIHGNGLLKRSRLILFLSGSSGYEMNPVSPLVIDREAFLKAGAFYLEKYARDGSKDFLDWFLNGEIGFWFREIFLQEMGSTHLKEAVKKLKERLLLITDPEDKVFPLKGIKKNLGSISSSFLPLGRHEFPFNLDAIDGKSYRELHEMIRKSYRPSTRFRKTFEEFIDEVSLFLNQDRS